MKLIYDKEMLEKAKREIDMWRRREIDNMLFVDTPEEEWFREILLSKPVGLLDVDGFADFMLKGYRKTHPQEIT